MQQAASADGVLSALGQATNEVPAWLGELQRTSARAGALQAKYFEKQGRLWSALLAGRKESVAAPQPGDRRFAAAQWRDNPYFDYLRQSYLLAGEFIEELVEVSDLEARAKERMRFAARQWVDALSPANFAATNPQFVEQALQTRGESITKGLANLLADVQKGRISQTDEAAFEVGRNVATTSGAVIYENDLIQLIQYSAIAPRVAARPLVMVPPCINKFYILDLQPENSLVRYALENGQDVFMISWRNIGPELGHLTWDDYLEKGVFQALRVAREVARADKVNALGFCVGGTLLGAALAVLAAKGEGLVASATFLTTMLDFTEAGPLGVFIDEAGIAAREAAIGRGGVMSGKELDFVFSSLRANDLVWPYVVHNYLLGQRPPAFDLLHWNSDGTNLPGPMFCYYLRNTYLENRLREPGALTNCGQSVDLAKVTLPSFVFCTREDHIVPWRSAYRSVNLLRGERTFVLGASGHIAGVVNPPSRKRRSHWTGDELPQDPEAWLSGAREEAGSWWPRWIAWLSQYNGGTRPAPASLGGVQYPEIEPAPGRYVKERLH
ncbi:MAG TPA: class I poly(R)-hydroxyalkanoic acid synthase [Burkholderiales bacterium]